MTRRPLARLRLDRYIGMQAEVLAETEWGVRCVIDGAEVFVRSTAVHLGSMPLPGTAGQLFVERGYAVQQGLI